MRIDPKRSLLSRFPEIAKEWHPTKNYPLTPESFSYGSKKKVWWQCPKFSDHEYEAVIKDRTGKKSRCPACANQTSTPEIRILSELKSVFRNVVSRKKIKGKEVDIYLPDISVGIEYDGHFFHKEKHEKDLIKSDFLLANGIFLIRIREAPLVKILPEDILVNMKIKKTDIDKILLTIRNKLEDLSSFIILDIDEYIKYPKFINQELYKTYVQYFPSPILQNSLEFMHPKWQRSGIKSEIIL